METISLVMGLIFVLGYLAITLEHKLHINKSGVALLLGAILWFLYGIFGHGVEGLSESISHETQEIFSVVVFLLAAMTLVEVLVHYKFFHWVQNKIIERNFSQLKLFWVLGALTFVFSAFLDNLTTTLIMIQIGRHLYKDKSNFLLFVINTVIVANAGGAPSPIGDVTTIMLWLADKFTAAQIIIYGILPSIAAWLVPQYLISRKMNFSGVVEAQKEDVKEEDMYWGAIIVAVISFTFPVIASFVGLPPFLGLLTGVGLVWILVDRKAHKKQIGCHVNGQLVNIVQKTDISTLKFFIGILLAVGALSHVGILANINDVLFGANPESTRIIAGNIILGMTSAVLDNVPLVAAAIKMFADGLPFIMWVLLAITAGVGGSMLVVGSAAGVAAMGQVKELTFGYYLKNGTVPAIAGFVSAVLVWWIVYSLLF